MLVVNRDFGIKVFEIDEDYQEVTLMQTLTFSDLSGGENPFAELSLDGFEIHGFVGSNMVLFVDRDYYLTKIITILNKKLTY